MKRLLLQPISSTENSAPTLYALLQPDEKQLDLAPPGYFTKLNLSGIGGGGLAPAQDWNSYLPGSDQNPEKVVFN